MMDIWDYHKKLFWHMRLLKKMKEFDQYTHVYKIDDDCKIFKKISKEFYDFINRHPYSGAVCNYVIYPRSGKRNWH